MKIEVLSGLNLADRERAVIRQMVDKNLFRYIKGKYSYSLTWLEQGRYDVMIEKNNIQNHYQINILTI